MPTGCWVSSAETVGTGMGQPPPFLLHSFFSVLSSVTGHLLAVLCSSGQHPNQSWPSSRCPFNNHFPSKPTKSLFTNQGWGITGFLIKQ